jgi:hypothetical protein
MTSWVSPFLGIGTTLAAFYSEGKTPCWRDNSKRAVKEGAITTEHRFRREAGIPSGPVALEGDKLDNKDWTSDSDTFNESRQLEAELEGVKRGEELVSEVKTDVKNWLKPSAFSFAEKVSDLPTSSRQGSKISRIYI